MELSVSPEEVRVTPGDRVRVLVRAKNLSTRDVVARVSHRIEPKAQADSLAVVQCPLLLPVALKSGQIEEFVSEYVVLRDPAVKEFEVTYVFARDTGS